MKRKSQTVSSVNLASMIASDVVRGDVDIAAWNEPPGTNAIVLDVREPGEYAGGCIAGAVNIPLGELQARLDELPREREIWVYCRVGQRAYYECRILSQSGFRCQNLSGGYLTYRVQYPQGCVQCSIV